MAAHHADGRMEYHSLAARTSQLCDRVVPGAGFVQAKRFQHRNLGLGGHGVEHAELLCRRLQFDDTLAVTMRPLEQMHVEAEGRILSRDWARYNGRDAVVFEPKLMSADALLEGYRRAYRRFYSASSIARRLARSPVGLWWTLPLNAAYAAAAWRAR